MLFEFEKYFKSFAWILGSWIVYGLFGFEFAAITLLSILVVKNITK
jgi:hypothetical protein